MDGSPLCLPPFQPPSPQCLSLTVIRRSYPLLFHSFSIYAHLWRRLLAAPSLWPLTGHLQLHPKIHFLEDFSDPSVQAMSPIKLFIALDFSL